MIENTEENRKKICKVIQKYNCEKKYNLKNCNCQNFSQDIFKALHLNNEFKKMEGKVGTYLNYIINKGRNSKDHCFLLDSKQNIIVDNDRRLVWDDHKEFDIWCNNEDNMKKCKKKKKKIV